MAETTTTTVELPTPAAAACLKRAVELAAMVRAAYDPRYVDGYANKYIIITGSRPPLVQALEEETRRLALILLGGDGHVLKDPEPHPDAVFQDV